MFHNSVRNKKNGDTAPPIDSPNKETFTGVLLELSLLRSRRGKIFEGRIIAGDNPDNVVFHLIADAATLMSHAGNKHQGFDKWEFCCLRILLFKNPI